MTYVRMLRLLVAAGLMLLLSGCGLFGGDATETDVATSETVTAVPTTNNVQPVPAATQPAVQAAVADEEAAAAPLPTAVTLPATPVPPEPTPDRSQPLTHVVQQGDVLGLIAERYDVEIADLRELNGLSGNLIKVGQSLTIPALTGTTESADETTAATAAPSSPTTPPAPVTCGGGSGHCVQSGESLLGIANKYGVTVEAIRNANASISGDLIRTGDLLTIPGSSGGTTGGTTGGTVVDTSQTPVPTAAPATNAECVAANPDFPYFHAADGKCYGNPIGGPTAEPTTLQSDFDQECVAGTFLWNDGLCYPIPGTTAVAATPGPTATGGPTSTPDPGTTPVSLAMPASNECPDGYFEDATGRWCFLE